MAVRASALVAPAAMTAGLPSRVVQVSPDANPVSPLGIAMSNTAALEVPTLVTEALDPGGNVVTVPTVTVAASPLAPVAPVLPVSPLSPRGIAKLSTAA